MRRALSIVAVLFVCAIAAATANADSFLIQGMVVGDPYGHYPDTGPVGFGISVGDSVSGILTFDKNESPVGGPRAGGNVYAVQMFEIVLGSNVLDAINPTITVSNGSGAEPYIILSGDIIFNGVSGIMGFSALPSFPQIGCLDFLCSLPGPQIPDFSQMRANEGFEIRSGAFAHIDPLFPFSPDPGTPYYLNAQLHFAAVQPVPEASSFLLLASGLIITWALSLSQRRPAARRGGGWRRARRTA